MPDLISLETLPFIGALILGILCSISPCPLASNIAAMSFVSRHASHRTAVLTAGVAYSLGRSTAYLVISALTISALVNIPYLSEFLQKYMNKLLGPFFVILGLYFLDMIKIPVALPSFVPSTKITAALEKQKIIGSFLLGNLLALTFCPVSAALFWGSLIPLAVEAKSSIGYPILFGIGTSIPVLIFAVLLAAGSPLLDLLLKRIVHTEKLLNRLTGLVFIGIGLLYIYQYYF
jgi:threonine/homoserine/homoserine lactone efflux protein